MTFDKFTIKAQDAIAVAQQKASEYNNQQIEPEHILKAMLSDAEGIISTILKKAGLNLSALEASVDHELGRFQKFKVEFNKFTCPRDLSKWLLMQ